MLSLMLIFFPFFFYLTQAEMVAMGKRLTEMEHDVEPGKRPRGGSCVEDMNHDSSILDEETGIINGEEVREFKPTHKPIVPITPAAKDYTRPPLKNINASRGNGVTLANPEKAFFNIASSINPFLQSLDLVFQWTDIDMAGELPYAEPPNTICPKVRPFLISNWKGRLTLCFAEPRLPKLLFTDRNK